ncbi:hypothetical protein [Dactylosporangium salmoneum]|uniref:Uncharacterized protein n=1 Tax=Dactylosporangium salmoneum TaxID=53361 RepID=A0ABN3FMJ5_9ACTN
MWQTIKAAFLADAGHATVAFVPDEGAEVLRPDRGYVRVWLVEGYLAKARTWGNDHFPALHGGAALNFAGRDLQVFAKFTRAPAAITGPGVQLNFQLTPLLPYEGGVVEVEAALFRTTTAGPLAAAADLVGALTPLLGPPLSTAAAVVERIGTGLDAVVKQAGERPVLTVHQSFVAAGDTGGGPQVRSGYLVVANTAPGTLGPLSFPDGLLYVSGQRPTGVDFLVLRLECRAEPDHWGLARFEKLVNDAGAAHLRRQQETFEALRTEAVTAAWNCPDFVRPDRKRLARLIAEEIDAIKELGAVARPARPLDEAAARALPSRRDPDIASLRLNDLL